MSADEKSGAEPPAEEASARQSTPFLVLQFFVFPMSIVAVCVAVFVIFGLIASDRKAPRDYLAEVRTGGGLFNVKRWQAAFALANALGSEKDLARKDPQFAEDLVKLFEESKEDDPRVRRYLALSMGRLADPRVVPALRKVLQEDEAGRDAETLIYSIWALGALGDPAAEPDLLRLAESEDAGIRKTAVHSLGAFPSGEARAALVKAAGDPVADVRWNAAVALGHRRDPAGTPALLQMLDRASLASVPGITPEQQEAALLEAATAAGVSGDAALRPALESLRDKDPSLKVREAARKALEGVH
jgi:HEAT repeat protein